ncbi:MAG: bifunctional precorrin-2 dehydrogenase/sirohydrochlorin ferrochelatase [Oscillospiraceae bacterium]|nr:bifunctional precorrin-2 dehydrogenase/sirohydrochlorin ferrochelatase [Oscillospiraceae bacterium]
MTDSVNSCGSYLPVFIPAAGRRALVAGGGQIALRRVRSLLKFGVRVTVVAPEICEELTALEREGVLETRRRPAAREDVTPELLLAVAASSDRACNRMIGEEARKLGIPVSVADCREESSFFFPAILEGGGVVGGLISINGQDHRLASRQAARLRAVLQDTPQPSGGKEQP